MITDKFILVRSGTPNVPRLRTETTYRDYVPRLRTETTCRDYVPRLRAETFIIEVYYVNCNLKTLYGWNHDMTNTDVVIYYHYNGIMETTGSVPLNAHQWL
jgi:hypothetical protein